jgi:hypothetical protein
VSSYAVVWVIIILGITLLGEAGRRASVEFFGSSHAAAWLVLLLMVMAILGGIVGGLIASAL